MTNRFIMGQYKPSGSIGHRFDPRAKILFAILLMILSVFTTSIIFYAGIIVGLFTLLLLSSITPPVMTRNLRPFIILILFTAMFHLVFSARETLTVVDIFGLRLTEGGIYMAIIFSLRVIVFVGIAFFISLTIAPSDLAEVLVSWLKPFKRIGVPSNDIGLIVFIAMRFIPVLAEEFETIRKAQTARGVDFKGRLTDRAKKLTYLLIPVFQSAIRRADELAVAIESRGFVSGAERSSYRHFRFLGMDWLFLLSSVIIALTLFWVTT